MPQELEQLRDIHLPAAISFWPMATGFYLILLLLLLAGLFGLVLYRTRYARRLRKQALLELASIKRTHLKHHEVSASAARISHLLKQVALLYYPRDAVAALQGEAWLLFLTKTSKRLSFEHVRVTLLEAPFCAECHAPIEPLFTVTKAWIKQRSRLWLH